MERKRRPLRKFAVSILILIIIILAYASLSMAPFMKISNYKGNEPSITAYEGESEVKDKAGILETNEEALDYRINLCNMAKESIILTTFDFREDKSTWDFGSAILNAANRGVKVKILVDGLSGFLRMNNDFFYSLALNKNIEIKLYNKIDIIKPWKLNGRMHDKYFIVDNKYLIMGGRNTFDYFLGNYNKKNMSYDREVIVKAHRVTNSVITDVVKYFNEMWDSHLVSEFKPKGSTVDIKETTENLQDHYLQLKEKYKKVDINKKLYRCNKLTFISGDTSIYCKKPIVWSKINEILKGAKDSAFIATPYLVLNNYLMEDIKNLANNIDLSISINSPQTGDNIVASSDYISMYKKYKNYLPIRLYQLYGKHSSHSKSILVDDRISIIGSYNLDLRSTYMDTEVMLVIDSKDFATQLKKDINNRLIGLNAVVGFGDNKTIFNDIPTTKRIVLKIIEFFTRPYRVAI